MGQPTSETKVRAPWHLWVVGVVSLLWYAAGAYTIQMAQLGRLPHLSPDELAYYAAKPVWLIAITAISTYGSALASVLLLLRSRAAVWLFAIALVFIVLNNGIELAKRHIPSLRQYRRDDRNGRYRADCRGHPALTRA